MIGDDKSDHELGEKIVRMLGLEYNDNGDFDTAWGDKTHIGIARSLRSIIEDHQ